MREAAIWKSRSTPRPGGTKRRQIAYGRANAACGDLRLSAGHSAAASLTYLAVGVRIVTSSSAAVGCSANVASKSALVAFIFTAMATAWMISAAVSPTMWQPTHAVGGAVDHELHQDAGVAAGHGRFDRPERRSCRCRRGRTARAPRPPSSRRCRLPAARTPRSGSWHGRPAPAACRTRYRRTHGPRGSPPASG